LYKYVEGETVVNKPKRVCDLNVARRNVYIVNKVSICKHANYYFEVGSFPCSWSN